MQDALDMGDQQSISITVLQQALEAKRAELRHLEWEIGQLEQTILQLQRWNEEGRELTAFIDGETAAALISRQEKAVEDEEKFPASNFKGMSREEIAVVLARSFDGYLTTGAFRKVLSKPGVLRSTSQVGSVASRVLKGSAEFVRIWEGLYRLKN